MEEEENVFQGFGFEGDAALYGVEPEVYGPQNNPNAPKTDTMGNPVTVDEKGVIRNASGQILDSDGEVSVLPEGWQFLEDIPIFGGVVDFIGDLGREAQRGYYVGRQIDETAALATGVYDDEDVQDYIEAVERTEGLAQSAEMQDFQRIVDENDGSVWGVMKGLFHNPSVAPQIMASSLVSMINQPGIAGAATTGGATAATGVGAAFAPAVALGTLSAVTDGMISFNEFLKEELDEKGLAFNDENVNAILNNKEAIGRIRTRAAGRGIAIGLIDGLTLGAAKAVSSTVKGLSGVRAAAVAAAGTEAVGGATGEFAGQVVSGQEINAADIILEGIAEIGGPGTITAVAGLSAEKVGAIEAKPIDNSIQGVATSIPEIPRISVDTVSELQNAGIIPTETDISAITPVINRVQSHIANLVSPKGIIKETMSIEGVKLQIPRIAVDVVNQLQAEGIIAEGQPIEAAIPVIERMLVDTVNEIETSGIEVKHTPPVSEFAGDIPRIVQTSVNNITKHGVITEDSPIVAAVPTIQRVIQDEVSRLTPEDVQHIEVPIEEVAIEIPRIIQEVASTLDAAGLELTPEIIEAAVPVIERIAVETVGQIDPEGVSVAPVDITTEAINIPRIQQEVVNELTAQGVIIPGIDIEAVNAAIERIAADSVNEITANGLAQVEVDGLRPSELQIPQIPRIMQEIVNELEAEGIVQTPEQVEAAIPVINRIVQETVSYITPEGAVDLSPGPVATLGQLNAAALIRQPDAPKYQIGPQGEDISRQELINHVSNLVKKGKHQELLDTPIAIENDPQFHAYVEDVRLTAELELKTPDKFTGKKRSRLIELQKQQLFWKDNDSSTVAPIKAELNKRVSNLVKGLPENEGIEASALEDTETTPAEQVKQTVQEDLQSQYDIAEAKVEEITQKLLDLGNQLYRGEITEDKFLKEQRGLLAEQRQARNITEDKVGRKKRRPSAPPSSEERFAKPDKSLARDHLDAKRSADSLSAGLSALPHYERRNQATVRKHIAPLANPDGTHTLYTSVPSETGGAALSRGRFNDKLNTQYTLVPQPKPGHVVVKANVTIPEKSRITISKDNGFSVAVKRSAIKGTPGYYNVDADGNVTKLGYEIGDFTISNVAQQLLDALAGVVEDSHVNIDRFGKGKRFPGTLDNYIRQRMGQIQKWESRKLGTQIEGFSKLYKAELAKLNSNVDSAKGLAAFNAYQQMPEGAAPLAVLTKGLSEPNFTMFQVGPDLFIPYIAKKIGTVLGNAETSFYTYENWQDAYNTDVLGQPIQPYLGDRDFFAPEHAARKLRLLKSQYEAQFGDKGMTKEELNSEIFKENPQIGVENRSLTAYIQDFEDIVNNPEMVYIYPQFADEVYQAVSRNPRFRLNNPEEANLSRQDARAWIQEVFGSEGKRADSRRLELKEYWTEEFGLTRALTWNNSYVKSMLAIADEVHTDMGVKMFKDPGGKGTLYGSYSFPIDQPSGFIPSHLGFNQDKTKPDTISHEFSHAWHQVTLFDRPALANKAAKIIAGSYGTQLLENAKAKGLYQQTTEQGDVDEAFAMVMGREIARLTFNNSAKPLENKTDVAQQKAKIEALRKETEGWTVDNINTIEDLAKVVAVEVYTGETVIFDEYVMVTGETVPLGFDFSETNRSEAGQYAYGKLIKRSVRRRSESSMGYAQEESGYFNPDDKSEANIKRAIAAYLALPIEERLEDADILTDFESDLREEVLDEDGYVSYYETPELTPQWYKENKVEYEALIEEAIYDSYSHFARILNQYHGLEKPLWKQFADEAIVPEVVNEKKVTALTRWAKENYPKDSWFFDQIEIKELEKEIELRNEQILQFQKPELLSLDIGSGDLRTLTDAEIQAKAKSYIKMYPYAEGIVRENWAQVASDYNQSQRQINLYDQGQDQGSFVERSHKERFQTFENEDLAEDFKSEVEAEYGQMAELKAAIGEKDYWGIHLGALDKQFDSIVDEIGPAMTKRLVMAVWTRDMWQGFEKDIIMKMFKKLQHVEMEKTPVDQMFDETVAKMADKDGNIVISRVVMIDEEFDELDTADLGSSWSVDPNFQDYWIKAQQNAGAQGYTPYVFYTTVNLNDPNVIPVGQYEGTTQSEIVITDQSVLNDVDWDVRDPKHTWRVASQHSTRPSLNQFELFEESFSERAKDLSKSANKIGWKYDQEKLDKWMVDVMAPLIPKQALNAIYRTGAKNVHGSRGKAKAFSDKHGSNVRWNDVNWAFIEQDLYVNRDNLFKDADRGLSAEAWFNRAKSNVKSKAPHSTIANRQRAFERILETFQYLAKDPQNLPYIAGYLTFNGQHSHLIRSIAPVVGSSKDLRGPKRQDFTQEHVIPADYVGKRLLRGILEGNAVEVYKNVIKPNYVQINLAKAEDKNILKQWHHKMPEGWKNGFDRYVLSGLNTDEIISYKSGGTLTQHLAKGGIPATFQVVDEDLIAKTIEQHKKKKAKAEAKLEDKRSPEKVLADRAAAQATILDVIKGINEKYSKANTKRKQAITKLAPEEVMKSIAQAFQGVNDFDMLTAALERIGRFAVPHMQTAEEDIKAQLAEQGDDANGAEFTDEQLQKRDEQIRTNITVGWQVFEGLEKAGLLTIDVGWKKNDPFLVSIKEPQIIADLVSSVGFEVAEKGAWTSIQLTKPEDFTGFVHETGLPLISHADKTAKQQPRPVYDVVNTASSIPYEVHTEALDVYKQLSAAGLLAIEEEGVNLDELTPKLQKEYLAKLAAKANEYEFIINEASKVGNEEFFQMHRYDFRGRLYATPSYFNHQGSKLALSLFRFKNKPPIGEQGWRWMLIQATDMEGKRYTEDGTELTLLDQRFEHANTQLDKWMEVASDPMSPENLKYWQGADEPFLFLATIMEIHAAIRSGDPLTYQSGLPIHMDATNSGGQVLVAMMKDNKGARAANVIADKIRGDLYNEVGEAALEGLPEHTAENKEMFTKTTKDLKTLWNAVENATTKAENTAALQAFNEYRKANKDAVKQTIELYWADPKKAANIRKIVKGPVMTKYYSAGVDTMSMGMLSKFKEKYTDILPIYTDFLAKRLNRSADKIMPGPAELMKKFQQAAKKLAAEGKPVAMTAPITGFKMVQNPRLQEKKEVKVLYTGDNPKIKKRNASGVLAPKYRIGNVGLDESKAVSSVAPNIVHMYDSQLVAWLLLNAGYDVQTIHDSFGSAPGHAGQLFDDIRTAFVEIFEGDVLTEMFDQLLGPEDAQKLIAGLKNKGNLDISGIKGNEFAFSAGKGFSTPIELTSEQKHVEEANFKQRAEQYAVEDMEAQILDATKPCKI